MIRTGLILVVLYALARCPASQAADPPLAVTLVMTQVPAGVGPPPGWTPEHIVRADWFDGARVILRTPDGQVRVLSEGFHSASDPDVSFDGRRVLFAAKKAAADPWAIWEIGVDGRGIRAVTQMPRDCRSPIYAGRLFTLDASAPWQTILFVCRNTERNEQGLARSNSLYAVDLDGASPRRITFNMSDDFDPFQMEDSRVLYVAWRHTTGAAAPPGKLSLFAVNIDGTDHELFGAAQGRRFQQMPCATGAGHVVFVESDGPAWDGAGSLARISLRRPHHSYRPIPTPEDGRYAYPAPLTGHTILVSRRNTRGQPNYAICRLDTETGRGDVVFDTSEFHEVQAKPVQPRPLPDGRSTVVTPNVPTGVFYGLNCYETNLPMGSHLVPGSIKRLRWIEGVPAEPGAAHRPAADAASAARTGPPSALGPAIRRLLGEAPVEEDGSFNVEVPCDIPVELQMLDEHGMALATCRWIWVRPKEKRGCIGCHEDPERIPENAVVQALRRPSNSLTLPPNQRRSVGFREHVMPLIAARCASADCHGGDRTPLRMAAVDSKTEPDARAAYTALRSPRSTGSDGGGPSPAPSGKYVDAGQARTSPLVWRLFGGRDTARPWDTRPSTTPVAPMPPPGRGPALTPDELRTVIEWIDLGAAWETAREPPPPPSTDRKATP